MTTDAPVTPPGAAQRRPPPTGAALDAVPTLTDVLDWPSTASVPATADALPDDERLRAVVEPVLDRLAEALLRELRGELAAVLHRAARQALVDDAARQRDA